MGIFGGGPKTPGGVGGLSVGGVTSLFDPLRPSPTPTPSSSSLGPSPHHHHPPSSSSIQPPPVPEVDMSGLTEEEKAMIQSVMMKAQEFEKGTTPTIPSPKPPQPSSIQQQSAPSIQGFQSRPTSSSSLTTSSSLSTTNQPQSQQNQRFPGGVGSGAVEDAFQTKGVGGINQITSGPRLSGSNQPQPQPQPQPQQQQQQQQQQLSSDSNFGINQQQTQRQQQHNPPNQSQSINQEMIPVTSSQQPQQLPPLNQQIQNQNLQNQQNLRQELLYQNGSDLGQMKSQPQDYYQQQQQPGDNLLNQQQDMLLNNTSQQFNQQGLLKSQQQPNQSFMRNQTNQDQNQTNFNQQQQHQPGRQQPQIPQGQQQQLGLNQPQPLSNQLNQQQSLINQENSFMFNNNNQNLQDFSMSTNKINPNQQSNCLVDDNNNNSIGGNQLGIGVNSDGSTIMFDGNNNNNLNCGPGVGGNNLSDQERLTDSYGSNEINQGQLIQENNYSGNNMNSMDSMYQDSLNCLRNDIINNTSNSLVSNNQFNQHDQQFGNQQQQFNNSGFSSKSQVQQQPNQQQQPFPGSTINNNHNQLPQLPQLPQQQQQQFTLQSDQFSLPPQSQLPHLPQQLSSTSKLSTNHQPLNYSQQQQGTGLTNKPAFLDPASLFNQDNNSNNKSNNLIQSTSISSQNPMIQTSSSTTITSTGTFNRQLPSQGDVISQNQLKSNLHQHHHHQQQQQQNQNQYQQQHSQHLNQQQQQQQQQFQQLQSQQQSGQSIQQPQQLYQPPSSYSTNQFDQSMSFMRSNESQINNRDFQDYQEGIQADQLNQQLGQGGGGGGIQGQHQLMTRDSMGIKGSPVTYQQSSQPQQLNQHPVHHQQQSHQQQHLHQQPMETNFNDTNRFVSTYQSTNNSPNNINVIRGSMRPNLLQGKSSDNSLSSPLTGLIPRTVPLQSVRDQLLLSSSSSSSSVPTTSTSIVVSSSSIVTPNHHQSINNNCISHSNPTHSTSSPQYKNSISSTHPGNSLVLGSTINSIGTQELIGIGSGANNNNMITTNHQQQLIHSNSNKNNNNNNNMIIIGNNTTQTNNNNVNSYTQQLVHSQQMKRMEIGECWSPVSELSPIQDVSPSIEAAEQHSMQLHQQLASLSSSSSNQPSSSSSSSSSSSTSIQHSNSHLTKQSDEFCNGLHRVTSGTISGMLADFNKQMEALGTVSPTDDRSLIHQHSSRRSSLSRLSQLSSSTSGLTSSTIEPRSRSGSLTTNAIHPLSYSSLLPSLTQSTTTTTTTATTTTTTTTTTSATATDATNLIKSLQTSLRSATTTAATTTSSTISTNRLTKGNLETVNVTTSKLPSSSSDAISSTTATINGNSILVTPGNLQLLAQSLPPAQLAIPRTVTHQVELAVSPVVEQTLQQQQMLIQQQQQLIILQKELFQQQQEQRQKQEQLQKEQEKTRQKAKQLTEIQSQSSQGSSQLPTTSSSSSGPQQQQPSTSSGHHHTQQHRQVQTITTTTTPTTTTTSSSSSTHHRHTKLNATASAPSTPNRKDRRRLPQPTIEEMQGAVQAISNQTSASTVYPHGSSLNTSKASTLSGVTSQLLGSRPISPLIPRKNQVIGVPIIPPMSRARPTPASTTLTMATPTLVSSSIATASSLLDPRHGFSASSLGLVRGVSPLSMLDETQSEAGGLKNKRRLPLVPLNEEPVTAAAVSRRLIKERLMSKSMGGNLSSKSVPILRSASSLDHTPSGYLGGISGLGPLTKEAPGALTGIPLGRSRPQSGPISPFSSLSDIANLINSSASGLAGLDLHRPHTPIGTLHSTIPGVTGALPPYTAASHLPTSTLANYLGINGPGSVSGLGPGTSGLSPFGLTQKSPFITSSLPSNSPITSPMGLGGGGGGYIKSLKSQLKDELRSVVDERRRLLDAREMARDKQDFYRRSETDLQALYDLNSYENDAVLARRALFNRRRPLGTLRRGDTLDPKALGPGYAASLLGDHVLASGLGGLCGSSGLAPDLFKSYEYEFLDPGATSASLAYPGLLTTSSLTAGKSPFGGPAANNLRRPVSSLGVLGAGLNPTDMAYGLRNRMTNGEIDPGLRESFIPNFMDNVGDGGRLLGAGRFRRRSEGSLDETLFNSDPYNPMSLSGVRGYDDLRTNLTHNPAGIMPNTVGGVIGPNDRYRARPLLGSIGPAHSWHPSPYASEDEDDKLTREEKAARVKAEIARRRAQLMETGRAVADDLGGGGKLHVGPSGHHPSYYSSRDQTQQYSSSAYRRQGGGGLIRTDDYSPSGYDYYGSAQGNRCIHGSPTHVRRSRLTRDGLYSRSLDTGYEDYTTAPTHPHHPHDHLQHQHQHQQQQPYDDYGYYNRANPGGNGVNRPVTNDYQVNYSGLNVANHNQPSQSQPIPAIKRPKYPFPVKRILLIRDPKERAHGGNCYGLRLIGGQEIPGTDQVGTFVEKTITGGAVDSLGEIREGDQVLEWNGLPLTGLSNEEVQRLVSASSNAEEVELVIRRDFNLFDVRYDYNSYNQCQVGTTESDYYTNNNNRGQMQQVTTGTVDGQYYQSP